MQYIKILSQVMKMNFYHYIQYITFKYEKEYSNSNRTERMN